MTMRITFSIHERNLMYIADSLHKTLNDISHITYEEYLLWCAYFKEKEAEADSEGKVRNEGMRTMY